MVFAEIIVRKTERNKNQSKQNEQGKTIIQKTYKTEKKKNKNKKKESLDGSVSLQFIQKPDQIKYKQTNKQTKNHKNSNLKKATRKQEIKESPGFQWSRFQRKR